MSGIISNIGVAAINSCRNLYTSHCTPLLKLELMPENQIPGLFAPVVCAKFRSRRFMQCHVTAAMSGGRSLLTQNPPAARSCRAFAERSGCNQIISTFACCDDFFFAVFE